ncbi:hypothetical protein ACH4T9_19945 [Micromonospora sp. NPDC020750]|uniref:hypothetical protein n=1 Tax=unclassified Micromonospora TaxID=2617518 RepID=UPI00379C67BF
MANETPAAPAAKKTTPAAPATKTPTAPTTPTGPTGPVVDPAAAAIRDAAQQTEIRQLTAERDELRSRVGNVSELETLRAEVAALRETAARSGVGRSGRWTMSAGVAADLETTGYATDPNTGDAYVRDGDQVTVTSRGAGGTRTIAMPPPSGAGDRESADRKN